VSVNAVDQTRTLLNHLAYEIRRRREANGFSQEGLAEECGLHRTYIGAIERSERNVTVGTLIKISNALDCDITDLLKRENV
jgi:transcriptional regulator with XRE-family HTH domain